MVVIAIVMVVAAAAAPAIGAAFRERKTSTAALDVVRAFRNARSAAAGYGRAYMVRYVQTNDHDRGDLQVFRGMTNRCNGGVFSGTHVQGMGYSALTHATDFPIELRLVPTEQATLELCYEPTGQTYWRTTAPRFSTESFNGASAFRFSVTRRVGGAVEGVVRYVVVPLGGDARISR
ncbi:MAG: hypothetical protein H5U40_00775 [Polyangiaceae bacterium]|nr:hypothetical protein [Polyangiaceae bacterium]